MLEPLVLEDICLSEETNLRVAMNKAKKGTALVYNFKYPNAFFFGWIPPNFTIVWRYPKEEELKLQTKGYTYFTWSHSCELLVNTGLVIYTFPYDNFKISVTFHIFDPLKFTSKLRPEELKERIQIFLDSMILNEDCANNDEKDNIKLFSKMFFKANSAFQPIGVGITQILPIFND